MEDAMRAKDRARLDVIRQIRTEATLRAAEPNFDGEIDDALYTQVISSYIRKMSKAQDEYQALGDAGAEMAEKLAFEVSYLERWVPAKLSEDETRVIVRDAIADLGADDPKLAGRVIGHVMKQHGDDVDGAVVNRLVREELGS